ncbi:GTP-binding protein [Jiangella muralis]|uniref:GTP-binding protein n=1 Tax=Jiangella muralis TaxID=702383 RepID=UPI00069DD0EB|nr:GTP-binding protein [Jiangella muralis]
MTPGTSDVPVVGLVGGFLGAGKTTLLAAMAERLRSNGTSVVIVTNDQGTELLDTDTAQKAGVPVGEVTDGCFCCRFDDLAAVIDVLIEEHRPDVILAEAVGSCTDLAATVVRPLRAAYGAKLRLAPLMVAVDPYRLVELAAPELDRQALELGWLLHTQLEEADRIVATKADLAATDEQAAALAEIAADYASTPLTRVSAVTGDGLDQLLDDWIVRAAPVASRSLTIDYERYGAAEAMLGWVDRRLRLDGTIDPDAWLSDLLAALDRALTRHGGLVGHVKLSAGSGERRAKGSVIGPGRYSIDERHAGEADGADVLINARVEMSPADLAALVDECVRVVSTRHRVDVVVQSASDKAPGFPRPTHRIPASA